VDSCGGGFPYQEKEQQILILASVTAEQHDPCFFGKSAGTESLLPGGFILRGIRPGKVETIQVKTRSFDGPLNSCQIVIEVGNMGVEGIRDHGNQESDFVAVCRVFVGTVRTLGFPSIPEFFHQVEGSPLGGRHGGKPVCLLGNGCSDCLLFCRTLRRGSCVSEQAENKRCKNGYGNHETERAAIVHGTQFL